MIDVANDLAFGVGAYTIQKLKDTVQELPKKAMAGAAVGVFAAAAAIISSVETKEVEEGASFAISLGPVSLVL